MEITSVGLTPSLVMTTKHVITSEQSDRRDPPGLGTLAHTKGPSIGGKSQATGDYVGRAPALPRNDE